MESRLRLAIGALGQYCGIICSHHQPVVFHFEHTLLFSSLQVYKLDIAVGWIRLGEEVPTFFFLQMSENFMTTAGWVVPTP